MRVEWVDGSGVGVGIVIGLDVGLDVGIVGGDWTSSFSNITFSFSSFSKITLTSTSFCINTCNPCSLTCTLNAQNKNQSGQLTLCIDPDLELKVLVQSGEACRPFY